MKKGLCVLLVMVMLVSFVGCGIGDRNEDVRGEIISNTPTENVGQDENEEQPENEPAFALGKAADNTYRNEFLGISCTLPDDWEFYTDEQILEMNNILEDALDEDVAAQLEEANIIYDMYATCETDGSNMNINLEKLSAVQMITMDIRQTLESQFDAIKSTYANIGYTDTHVEYQEVIVDGKVFDGVALTAKIQGIDFYGTIFAFRKGNYLANVTICSLFTDTTDTILSYFTVE